MRVFNRAIVGAAFFAILSLSASAQSQPNYRVYFEFQVKDLADGADAVAAAAEHAAVAAKATQIDLVGNADTAEADAQALSLARANAVKAALLRHHLPKRVKITVKGDGATNLFVPTDPGTQEPLNRSVAVTIH